MPLARIIRTAVTEKKGFNIRTAPWKIGTLPSGNCPPERFEKDNHHTRPEMDAEMRDGTAPGPASLLEEAAAGTHPVPGEAAVGTHVPLPEDAAFSTQAPLPGDASVVGAPIHPEDNATAGPSTHADQYDGERDTTDPGDTDTDTANVNSLSKQKKRRNCQPATTLKLPDRDVVVSRNPDGKFPCPFCSRYSSDDPGNLRKHVQTCERRARAAGQHASGKIPIPVPVPVPVPVLASASYPAQRPPVDEPVLKREDLDDEEEIHLPPGLAGETIDLTEEERVQMDQAVPDDYDSSLYINSPGEYDIVDHPRIKLSVYDLTVNNQLHCVSCIECKRVLELGTVKAHIRAHVKNVEIPEDIVDILMEEFGVVPCAEIDYPPYPITPVFGIQIRQSPHYFCGVCHRGYTDSGTLRVHQSTRCYTAVNQRQFYVTYAQTLQNGRGMHYFPVDISKLTLRKNNQVDYVQIFQDTYPPPTNYSKLPITCLEDKQNLSQFVHREGWLNLLEGYTPEDIVDACRPTVDEPWSGELRGAATRYLETVQILIRGAHTYGILKTLCTVSPMQVVDFH
ncbi:hypothetical protein GALMADRAFT_210699 [Galerina marginata CBS 339.88]|uniref:Uncharacterized protein n=1 Tax=Galerina marginata (strain CBS 339.88) TaxID=685588 RepID=A0A067T0Z4_GALM3|nr:hypothetical protein GALMADRAFT_210699 [Galerina marginata CBS 339.88]